MANGCVRRHLYVLDGPLRRISECVEIVLAQTYDPLEVVIVVGGNLEVFDCVQEDFGAEDDTVLFDNEEKRGISYSRTKGAELASGEIVGIIPVDQRSISNRRVT